ncbi:carbamoyltransferase HypF [uncultured Helicobacter sp.]|uniref:carbamoyltransferase HypF n=1 Tax=uncultured Helicobacter sp. TaxID=175537 RepID=UPI00262D0E7A|nr:carbamoyltransferase HypF [uncultured Helicobacter sp.]
MKTLKIQIQGIIQGVGFRPFVSNLAHSLNLCGYVKNNSLGVEVLVQGERCEEFLRTLPQKAPKVAQIQKIDYSKIDSQPYEGFEILQSEEANHYLIPPILELGICENCRKELFAKDNPRYFYPLINCTNCGPRYSVIKALPYDRERTSMAEFEMCEKCKEQYTNPRSRFFHAQPISCPACSPKIYWRGEVVADCVEIFKDMALSLREGEILLIEGIGGFHLVCDASNEKTIQKLRELKNRPSKPFALMCKNLEQVREIAFLTPKEEEILLSPKAPIVLLKAKQYLKGIAPNLQTYGVMLPYTPIYELLFSFLHSPLVVTSANPKGEPIIYKREDLSKLAYITTLSLSHQREIDNPIEDSIVQVLSTQEEIVLRNARGYAPTSFRLPYKLQNPLLSLGGNQKANFSIAFEDMVILSPYIGDLDNLESISRFRASIKKFQELYGIKKFEQIACDLHPNYESSKIAKDLAEEMGAELVQLQHHFAHTLSVCFEYGISEKILSFCFDGTGYGEDGAIWGGEVLEANKEGFERVAHFRYFKLLGGEVATKDIARNFLSIAFDYLPLEEVQKLECNKTSQEIATLYQMHQKSLNSPLTSSVGRLFDMVAFMCGLEVQSYEGESGVWLQNLYAEGYDRYGFAITKNEIELDFLSILKDYKKQSKQEIASKFINTLVEVICTLGMQSKHKIILCGGVFCNNILSAKVLEKLRKNGKTCYIGNKIPPNDNSLSLGQMYYLLKE